jgi:hypothetical protein
MSATAAVSPLPDDLFSPVNCRSGVWEHFRRSRSRSDVVFCIVANCKPKKREVKRLPGNTTNMTRHLAKNHPALVSSKPSSSSSGIQSVRAMLTAQSVASGAKTCSPEKKAEFNESVVRLIIGNCLSFNVVDSAEFINSLHLISGLSYIPPSRNALAGMVDSLYSSMVDVLLADLADNCINITTDAATLNGGGSYITVTAHYLTAGFVMRDVTLMVAEMTESHTGEYVSDLLDQVVEKFRLEKRVFAAVSDNGANFVKGVRINKHVQEQWRCMIHTMQLSLHNAVDEFEELHSLCREVQALVSRVRNSHILTDELLSIQVEQAAEALTSLSSPLPAPSPPPSSSSSSSSSSLPSARPRGPLRLIADAPTRFNSFCLVFTRLLDVKAAVVKLCADNPSQLAQHSLTTDQWMMVSEVLEILRPVKDACDILEGTLTPSISFVLPLICQLLVVLQRTAVQDAATPLRKQMAQFVAGNVYDRLKEALLSETTQVGMMLDPRVRTKTIPYLDKAVAQTTLRDTYRRFGQSLNEMSGRELVIERRSPVMREAKEEVEVEVSGEKKEEVRPAKRVKCLMELSEEVAPLPRSEMDSYLLESGIDINECPLTWWRERKSLYPTLFEMARVYLAIPASSAASERVFSAGKLILDHKRRRLTPDRVSRLMFLKKNLSVYDAMKNKTM